MSAFTDTLRKLWSKIATPSNVEKAGDAVKKLADKEAEKMRDKNKAGEATIAIAVCIAVSFVFGIVFGKGGVKTRCAIQQTDINIKGASNVVYVINGTNIVDVSGSGGVSIPVSGAK